MGQAVEAGSPARQAATVTVEEDWVAEAATVGESLATAQAADWTVAAGEEQRQVALVERDLNFPDTQREYALWLEPPMHFVDVTDGHEQRREHANLRAAQIDELRMETLRRDHPELVQAELDFFARRKKKKATAARADGAGPSAPPLPPPNRINVGSSSSLGSSF
ncbi:hypothetical protein ZWY2020_044376 [Hordeum vulgare]|nr:hypothetical protein ZWY2020_044376 [Hordeum vulgare]